MNQPPNRNQGSLKEHEESKINSPPENTGVNQISNTDKIAVEQKMQEIDNFLLEASEIAQKLLDGAPNQNLEDNKVPSETDKLNYQKYSQEAIGLLSKVQLLLLALGPNVKNIIEIMKRYQEILNIIVKAQEIYERPNKNSEDNKVFLDNDGVKIIPNVKKLKELFTKECLVIWYDADAPSKEKEEDLNKLELESVNTNIFKVRKVESWEEACAVIEETKAFCVVISSKTHGELFVEKVYGKIDASRIYIFGRHLANLQIPWANRQGTKFSIENDIDEIIKKLHKQIPIWQKKEFGLRTDLPAFSPIFNEADMTDNNYLGIYLAGLTKFGDRLEAKADFQTLARAIYSDTKQMDKFETKYQEYNMKEILRWYTLDNYFYKLTNNCLRVANPETISYCRFAVKDLERAIKEHYQQKSKDYNGLLYRGTYISNEEWTQLEQNKGKDIEMYGFLSASKKESTAEFFIAEEPKKALITIIVLPAAVVGKEDQGFAEIKEFSANENEDEVLFNIRSRFTVLETTTQLINKKPFRHLVLLYGSRDTRKFMSVSNPSIEIKNENLQQFKCSLCSSNAQSLEKPLFFVNLANHNQQICFNCIEKSHDIPALVSIPSSLIKGSAESLKVEALLIKYQKNLNIPFYGYECGKCSNKHLNRQFTCQMCSNPKKKWCENCFNESNDCLEAGHLIVLENQPYTFFNEKMSEMELMHSEYKYEMFNQGHAFLHTNDLKRARDYYEKALKENQQKDPKILVSLNSELGHVYLRSGLLPEAKKCYLDALEICKSVYKTDNSQTAMCYSNLGSLHFTLNEIKETIECRTNALRIFKSIYGEKHPQIALAYGEIGLTYILAGQFEEAKKHNLNAIEMLKSFYGSKHPFAIGPYNSLGLVYRNLGQFNEAVGCISKALEICKSAFGLNHAQTATSYSTLGSVYENLGRFEDARQCHSNAYEICRIVYGDNHFHTGRCKNNIGSVYESLARYQEAIKCFLEALEIFKATYVENHPQVALIYNNLGSAYGGLGQLDEALKYHLNALKISKLSYPSNKIVTATYLANVGSVYDKLGSFKEALPYHSEALEIRKEAYGSNPHPDLASSYEKSGRIYKRLLQFDKALESHKKALEIRESFYKNQQHPDIASSYSNVGSVYQSLRDFEKAKEYHLKALEMCKLIFIIPHPLTATVYSNLATAYQSLHQINEAMEYHEKALEIEESVFGKKHHNVAISHNNIGSLYQSLGQFEEAKNHYKTALEISESVVGNKHPDVAAFLNNLGEVYSKLKQFDEAVECHLKALIILESAYGKKHSFVVKTYKMLGSVYEISDQSEKAKECHSIALELEKQIAESKPL